MVQGQWLLYVLLLVFELQSTKVNRKGSQTLNTGYIMMTSLLVSSSVRPCHRCYLRADRLEFPFRFTEHTQYSLLQPFFLGGSFPTWDTSYRIIFLGDPQLANPLGLLGTFFCHFQGLLDPGSSEQLPMGRHECRCRQYQWGAGGAGDGCDSWNM